MNILAFSDLHRDVSATKAIVDASRDADLVIGAGDYATRCVGLRDCVALLLEIEAPVVLVPGNHDRCDELVSLCRHRPNVHVLHGGGIDVCDRKVFGLGFEIPSRSSEAWNQTLTEAEAESVLEQCPPECILVTHTPPFGVADEQKDGSHEGSVSLMQAVRNKKPVLHLCGHIHNSWGSEGMIGETIVKNLGPTINWFSL